MKNFLDKSGLVVLWNKIKGLLDNKVDKIENKGLSTNDFTNDDKNKLDKVHVPNKYYINLYSDYWEGDKSKETPLTTADFDYHRIVPGDIVVVEDHSSNTDFYAGFYTVTGYEPDPLGQTYDNIYISNGTARIVLRKVQKKAEAQNYNIGDIEVGWDNINDKPTIPTKISQLTNDSNYQTKTEVNTAINSAISVKADKSEIPVKVSQLTNDSGFQTLEQVNDAIQNIVGAAPEALDTLEEIASKLANNDDIHSSLVTTISGKVDKVEGKQLTTNDFSDEYKDKVDSIDLDAIDALIDTKVDKVAGKGLSTNDFTTIEKNKLAGIASGAEVNVQSDWNESDSTSDAFIKNKPTSMPASDVSAWAKAPNKPSYKYSEISGTPTSLPANGGNSSTVNGHTVNSDVPANAKFTDTTYTNATTTASGLMSASDKTKLNSIASGAEVNQNAFSNVKVGNTTVSADTKTDTIELVAGSNVTITPDATNDKITISSANTTYGNATTSASGLMSANDKKKLDGIASGANVNTVTSVAGKTGAVTLVKGDVGLGNVSNDAQVKRSEMGVASGVATLGTDGKVPSSQLPSYVDDVLEYAKKASFPTTGESGKIYIAQDTNLTYRWSGTAYVEISQSLALGETASTAYAGNKGKATTDSLNSHIANKSNPHGVTKSQVGLGNVDNTSDANKPVSTAQATAIADAKKAGSDAQTNLTSHIGNKSNPHGVTKAQVGLGNVTNDAQVTIAGNQTITGFKTFTKSIGLSVTDANTVAQGLDMYDTSNTRLGGIGMLARSGTFSHNYLGWGNEPWNSANNFQVGPDTFAYKGSKIWHAGNDGSGSGLDADTLDGNQATVFPTAKLINFKATATSGAQITTEQFITRLKELGAFDRIYTVLRTTWSYADNDTITDTGCGKIQLAGANIETFHGINNLEYTVRITTAPTVTIDGAIANAVFIYRNHGAGYSPNWKRLANITDTVANANAVNGYLVGYTVNKIARNIAFASATELVQKGYCTDANKQDTQSHLKGQLMWLCNAVAPNINLEQVFQGSVSPNSKGFCHIHMYNTTNVDATTKLPRYSSGAYYTLEGGIKLFGTYNYEWYYKNADTTYSNATTSVAGLMSSADKTKLNSIASGANNYSLPVATASALGGIKLGTASSNTQAPIKVNSSNQAYADTSTLYNNIASALSEIPRVIKVTNVSYDKLISATGTDGVKPGLRLFLGTVQVSARKTLGPALGQYLNTLYGNASFVVGQPTSIQLAKLERQGLEKDYDEYAILNILSSGSCTVHYLSRIEDEHYKGSTSIKPDGDNTPSWNGNNPIFTGVILTL